MSTNNTYLAVFLGSKTSPRRLAWDALPEGDRRAKEREGMRSKYIDPGAILANVDIGNGGPSPDQVFCSLCVRSTG